MTRAWTRPRPAAPRSVGLQIQHRQRKANYAKGMEMDIVRLRDAIERCKADCRGLAGENRGMREQLASVTVATGPLPQQQQQQQVPLGADQAVPSVMSGIDCSMTMAESGIDGISNPMPPTGGSVAWAASSFFSSEPDYMTYLNVDKNPGSPAFQVTRDMKPDQEGRAGFVEEVQAPGSTLGGADDQVELARGPEEETYRAINFILAYDNLPLPLPLIPKPLPEHPTSLLGYLLLLFREMDGR
ncbi:hypothetical protein PG997_004723 [Apiospora hydei]|uniref:BZIP domain-containing protein n=1 Tax=Apiospora hydei TaxID=1337664 RepID=A0ABR1X334_9PEZI